MTGDELWDGLPLEVRLALEENRSEIIDLALTAYQAGMTDAIDCLKDTIGKFYAVVEEVPVSDLFEILGSGREVVTTKVNNMIKDRRG